MKRVSLVAALAVTLAGCGATAAPPPSAAVAAAPTAAPTIVPTPRPSIAVPAAPTAVPPSVAVDAYASQMVPLTREFSDAIVAFGDQNTLIPGNPAITDDSAWRATTAIDLARVQRAAHKMLDVGPVPANWSHVHTLVAQTASLADHMSASYMQGIEQHDGAKLQAAANDLKAISSIADQTSQEIRAATATNAPDPSPRSSTAPAVAANAKPITFDRTDFKGGFETMAFQIAVNLTNHDSKPHLMDVQANFYDVPLRQLGDDPADHLVTAGTTPKQLAAGQSAAVLINARNVANQRIMSVGFRAICHDASISADCGDGTPSQS